MASGDIKQFGMWKCVNSSNTVSYRTGGYWPYSIYYSEYSNGVTLVNYDSSKCSDDPIEWIEYNYNGKTVYIQNKLFFYSISIADSLKMCSKNEINIDGVKYKLSFMPKEFWTNLPSSICTLFKTDTSKKIYTNSPFYIDSADYYYSVYFNGSDFSYDSESIGVDTIDENYAFVPVLVKSDVSDKPIGPVNSSGYHYEFDMNMVAYNNSPSDGANIFQPTDINYLYTNPDHYSDNNYNNVAKTKNNISFVKSGSGFTTYKVYINNEAHYISKYPVLTCMDSANINDLLNKLRNFTIDDVTYEIKLLSADQWKILHRELYRDNKIQTVLERSYDTWDDGSVHETLNLAWMASSSYGYRNDNTSTENNYKRAYFKCGWFKDQNFPYYNIFFDNTIGEHGYFYPVIKEYNPDNEKNIEKFGTLQITRNGSSKLYPQPINSDCTTCSVYTDDTFTFVSTVDESLKWKWIKTKLDNKTIYISKVFLDADMEINTIISNMKNVTIDGIPYRMRLLSMDEWKSLDKEVLYQIDFGICKNSYEQIPNEQMEDYYRKSTACFRTLTSTTYKSSGNYEWFGGYDKIYHQRYVTGNTLERANPDVYPDQMRWGYLPVLELLDIPPTISGSDSNLGDKTQAFSIEYTVNDADSGDTLTVTEKLNGTTIRTINGAVRNQKYYTDINTSMFANLTLYNTNTITITVSDGTLSTTRTYTFRKTNTAPVINYTGSDNLGIISSKPTIKYTVTDAEGDEITITERLNGKVLQTYTVSSGTECTVNIPNMSWLGCGNTTSTIEINARDSAGGSSNKTITFTRAIDRIEVITNPIKTDKAVTKISLEVGWNTEGASGQVFVCNNGYDESPTWEDMTDSVGSNTVYNLTNTTKTASDWGVSVKVIVKKDGGSTGEVSLYSIKGTYE